MNLQSKEGAAGVTALLSIAIVIAINFLVGGLGFLNGRFDVTEDRLYTLSDGTRNILGNLSADEPVTLRFYVTTEDRVMPPMLKTYSRTVQDLILEFQKKAPGKVILEKLAPNPNTEDEDKAREDDIQGVPVNNEGDNIYLGLAVQCGKQKELLPFLNPNEETALEYNVARAIQKVSREKKTVIGVMSPMPIMGAPMMPFQRQQQGQQPWVLIQRLRMDYEVREVQMSSTSIEDGIDVLIVVHPADITEGAEYAIDQYLMKGGRVIALVDPQSLVAQRVYSQQQNPMTGQPGSQINASSDLPNLFKAWGVAFNKSDIVSDVKYRSQLMGRQTPVALRLPNEALSREDRITQNLQSLLIMMGGHFDINAKEGLSSTVLASSSEASEIIDSTAAEKLLREPMGNFNASGKRQSLAVMLKGKFKTAFPNGKPKGPEAAKTEGGGATEEANAPKAAEAPKSNDTGKPKEADKAKEAAPAKPSDGTLLESKNNEGVVVLFADADMMYDAFTVQQDPMTGGMIAIDGNLPMFLNAVEILSGGGDLLQVRSRASTRRPFAKMDELRESVESKSRPLLLQKQSEMDKIAQDMGPLRVKNGQLVDPTQIKKLQDLMDKQTQIKKEIREIKKKQNKEIDFTENIITLLNVMGVPLLVVAIGLTLAIRRRTATAAI